MRVALTLLYLRNISPRAALLLLCFLCSGCGGSKNAGSGYVLPNGFTLTASPMMLRRFQHTATLLKTGNVLLDGGGWTVGIDPQKLTQSGQPLPVDVPASGCEFYSASTKDFSPCVTQDSPRYGHTATALQDGTVLIAGGVYRTPATWPPQQSFVAQAELFDPSLNQFSSAASLNTPRLGHTATLLNDGRVLIAGGGNGSTSIASAELYSTTAQTFSYTGNLNIARSNPTATVLRNGSVLIAGGVGAGGISLSSAELYNPSSGTFALAGSMNAARAFHTATLLSNGNVLIAGGEDGPNTILSSAEIYDPSTDRFTLASNMNVARTKQTATLLPNGIVLVAGGSDSSYNALSSAELYDPAAGTFTLLSAAMNSARYGQVATQLADGSVLLTGGIGPDPVAPTPALIATSSAELY